MEKILIISFIIFISVNSFAKNKDIIGEWSLSQKVVVDYDNNFNYENYNSYIILKSNLFKKTFTPEILYYEESTKLILNKDNTGIYKVDVVINNEKALIDLENKAWLKSDTPQLQKDFKWSFKDNILTLEFETTKHTYHYSINKLSDNLTELELKPDSNNLSEAGIYKSIKEKLTNE